MIVKRALVVLIIVLAAFSSLAAEEECGLRCKLIGGLNGHETGWQD